MRIIAGEARGRTLLAPKGQDTRPTQDYVRESLFNILQQSVPDARVLDLFAGSGALALEALSRGAQRAVLVDCATDAIQCINRNAESLGFAKRATIIRADWLAALTRLAGNGEQFTLVFLDPPYRMTETAAQCAKLADLALLAKDALVLIEHRRDVTPAPDDRFTETDQRRYGDTVIHFYRYLGRRNDDA